MRTESHGRLKRELLAASYVLVKNALVFDDNNPALLGACERMATATNELRRHSEGTASLQLLPDGVYVNHQLARLDSGSYEQGEYLYTVWKAVGVGEIQVLDDTGGDDWLEVVGELKRCIRGGPDADALAHRAFDNVKLAPLDEGSYGREGQLSERARAVRAYSVATIVVQEMLDDLRAGRRVRIVDLKRPLQELIALAPRCRALLLALVHLKRHKVTLASHLVNTATIALCVAHELELRRAVRTDLAMQACLHDIGRAFAAEGVAAEPATRDAQYAVESVCALLRLSAPPAKTIGRVVAANEARLWANVDPDVGDYPYTPSAPARLIAAARAFDLLTTATASRPALLPDEAMRVLMAEAGRRYDDAVVRVMVDALGVYPVGSVVALASGHTAVVVRASSMATDWAEPIVKIVGNPDGTRADGPLVDLSREQSDAARVRGCLDAEEHGINIPAHLMA